MEYAIECTGLKKRYPDFTLGPLNLKIERGTVTGLVGSNGAGKTTFIKLLLGLIFPDAGTIELALGMVQPSTGASDHLGEMRANPQNLPDYMKGKIGVVFDACAFPQTCRIADIAQLGRAAYKQWDDTLFDQLTTSFGLDSKKQVGKLSRGMGMKLSIAFAMAHHPELLILDEATAGLDPIARDEILDLLRDFMLDESHTILMSTHITSDLEKIADTIVCIDAGQIVFEKTKDELCDMAGVAHVRAAQLEELLADANEGDAPLHVIRREYGADVLAEDRFSFADAHPDIPVDKASIDDYMSLLLRGDEPC